MSNICEPFASQSIGDGSITCRISACGICDERTRHRRSFALDAVRKPPPRPRRKARGGAADRGTSVSRTRLSSRHAERRGGAAEHHQAGAVQLLPQQGGHSVRMLGVGAGAGRRDHRRHQRLGRGRARQAARAGARLCRDDGDRVWCQHGAVQSARPVAGEREDGARRQARYRSHVPALYRGRRRRRIDQTVRSEVDSVRDRRFVELDRPLVSARRRAVAGCDRGRIRGAPHRGAHQSTNQEEERPHGAGR